jgi:hypothetical protein
METLKEEIERNINEGYINLDLSPKKCRCGSISFKTINRDFIENILCEYEVYCKECNQSVGYWSYGVWLP